MLWQNRAWRRFAEENGAPGLARELGEGRNYFDGIAGPLRAWMKEKVSACVEQGRELELDYECSSAEKFRLFHLKVSPLPGDGLLLSHSLRIERPHDRSATETPLRGTYERDDGLMRSCSYCRRFETRDRTAWHWIPSWVARIPEGVSHGLCPVCETVYFPR
jgi:hypothetical protein